MYLNFVSTNFRLQFGRTLYAKYFTYHSSLCIIAILVSSDTKVMKNAFSKFIHNNSAHIRQVANITGLHSG